jgi:hypothetical protein
MTINILDVFVLQNQHMLRLFLYNKFVVPKNTKKQPLVVNNYDFVILTNESSCGLDVLIFDESRLYRFFINAFIYKHYVINSK